MSYQFKLDDLNGVVECEYEGLVSFDERMKAIEEGVAILQDREYPRILINLVAAKMQITRTEKERLAEFISTQHALINAKTAFLIRCEQTEREEVDNSVVRPDDFDSQVFYSRSKAIDWLSEVD